MSTNSTKRFGVLAALVFGIALFAGLAPAGAATPAVTNTTLTIDTKVENNGVGTAAPDFFTYHVFDNNTSADVADGVFNHNGVTKISLPPGTYGVTEDPLEPYEEHASSCGNVTISVGHPQTCAIKNIWTPATILVSTEVDNSAGGSATPASFQYKVIDTSDNKTVGSGTFDKSGTTKITEPDGTYTVTEDALNGYDEDATTCAGLTIDLADPASCIINNVFNPHDTTTAAPVTTAPAGKQVSVHGSVTNSNACIMSLVPALQSPAPSTLSVTLSADGFPQPHKGDPITLTNTKFSVATPASLLQEGVAVGIVKDGAIIPEHVKLVIAGLGTTQGTHTYSLELKLKAVVKNGEAQPLVASASLPDTTWTPSNATDPVFFSEQSLQLQTTISSPSIGTVTSTSTCNTPNAPTLIALSAQGATPPGGSRPTDTVPGSGGPGSSGQGTNVLPVTGTSVWLWLAPAVLSIYVGLLALGATSRKRRRTLNS